MHSASPPRPLSPLHHRCHQTTTKLPLPPPKKPTISTTKTYLANLNKLLQSQTLTHTSPPPPPPRPHPSNHPSLSLPFFHRPSPPPSDAEASPELPMSPSTLRRLLSSDATSSGPSPRNSIAPRWPHFHGASDWSGLLDPLHPDLRRELLRYGDLVHSAYHAYFHSPGPHRHVLLPDPTHSLVRPLFASSPLRLPWSSDRNAAAATSWIGFIAVCDSDREIRRLGRRDIVVVLRGTATLTEWAENLRANLVPLDDDCNAKVECGFRSLYKTPAANAPSLSEAIVSQVRRLVEQYSNEPLSITVTGHSLGAALAVLAGDELAASIPGSPPVAVFSFGGPRVGNRAFADRVERRGVKVLRVVNAHDVVPRVPPGFPVLDGYAHVGRELRVDSRASPYLRPDADPACCHDLEAYLHLVDGFLGPGCPFRSTARRSLVRLVKQQAANVKQKYMCSARQLGIDPAAPARDNVAGCLPSPS